MKAVVDRVGTCSMSKSLCSYQLVDSFVLTVSASGTFAFNNRAPLLFVCRHMFMYIGVHFLFIV